MRQILIKMPVCLEKMMTNWRLNHSFTLWHKIEKKPRNQMKSNKFVYYETNFNWNAIVCFGRDDDESLAEPGK